MSLTVTITRREKESNVKTHGVSEYGHGPHLLRSPINRCETDRKNRERESMTKTRGKAETLTTTEDVALPQVRARHSKQQWSYSRRNVLEQCARRYYYEYYAQPVAKARRDPQLEKVRRLKALQNRYERTGSIAHLVIATYLRKAQTGDVWKPHRLVDWARSVFHADLTYSARDPAGMFPPDGRFPPLLLQEYFYQHPDAAEVCRVAEDRLMTGLRIFVESVNFAEFRRIGSRPGAYVERNLSLGDFTCRVSGKVDLAFSVDSDVTIVDWKLGDPSGEGDDSLQLAAYALWAAHHFAVSSDHIKIYKAHLCVDTIQQFSVNERLLAAARARILQDVERMVAAHDYGQRGIEEAFTPCAKPRVCQLCPFQAICAEGSAVLHA